MKAYRGKEDIRRYRLSGDRLKQYMDDANLSVLELSRLTGLSRTAIYNLRHRNVKVKQSTLELIAMHLNVKFEDICKDDVIDTLNFDPNSIGQRLKLARLARGRTIKYVADKLDVKTSFISKCERDWTELKFRFVRDYCKVLEISMDSLNLDFDSFNTDVISKIISDR